MPKIKNSGTKKFANLPGFDFRSAGGRFDLMPFKFVLLLVVRFLAAIIFILFFVFPNIKIYCRSYFSSAFSDYFFDFVLDFFFPSFFFGLSDFNASKISSDKRVMLPAPSVMTKSPVCKSPETFDAAVSMSPM